jgi:hypothetical protein
MGIVIPYRLNGFETYEYGLESYYSTSSHTIQSKRTEPVVRKHMILGVIRHI